MKADLEKIVSQYKFCFKCAGKLKWKENKLLICQNCGSKNYLNAAPVNAAILVNNKSQVLLVERKFDPKKGFWDLPSGFVDFNENAEESTTREIKEELNVEIRDLKYFSSEYDLYTYDGVTFPTLGIIFTGSVGNQKIQVSDDVSGFKFFDKKEIPFDRIAFEGLQDALRRYIKK